MRQLFTLTTEFKEGKYKGKTLKEVLSIDLSYVQVKLRTGELQLTDLSKRVFESLIRIRRLENNEPEIKPVRWSMLITEPTGGVDLKDPEFGEENIQGEKLIIGEPLVDPIIGELGVQTEVIVGDTINVIELSDGEFGVDFGQDESVTSVVELKQDQPNNEKEIKHRKNKGVG